MVDVCTFRQKKATARTQFMEEEQLLILFTSSAHIHYYTLCLKKSSHL